MWIYLLLVASINAACWFEGEIKKLEGLDFGALKEELCMYTGTLKVDETDGELFYWYFHSPNDKDDKLPVTMWLNGGPGSSSMIGLFTENGPLRVFEQGETDFWVDYIDNSWVQISHVIFLD